jgi:hypothetical protein
MTVRALSCAACALLLGLASARADVKLHNKDSKAHDVTVACRSTVQRSIQPGTIATLGKGPCTVKVKSTGATMRGDGNDTIVLPKR